VLLRIGDVLLERWPHQGASYALGMEVEGERVLTDQFRLDRAVGPALVELEDLGMAMALRDHVWEARRRGFGPVVEIRFKRPQGPPL
jgi:hypothetical protein